MTVTSRPDLHEIEAADAEALLREAKQRARRRQIRRVGSATSILVVASVIALLTVQAGGPPANPQGRTSPPGSTSLAGVAEPTGRPPSTWFTNLAFPNAPEYFNSVSCWSAVGCVAVDPAQGVYVTADDGKTWGSRPDAEAPQFVACPSASQCFAVGSEYGAQTSYFERGSSTAPVWTLAHASIGFGQVADLACPTVRQCVAVGNWQSASGFGIAVGRTVDAGRSWTVERLRDKVSSSGVTCASVVECFIVGSDPYEGGGVVLETTDAGATWKLRDAPARTDDFSSISCASTQDCVAVGTYVDQGLQGSDGMYVQTSLSNQGVSVATTDGGASWSAVTTIPASGVLMSVGCTRPGQCTAVGQLQEYAGEGPANGVAYTTTDDGAKWVSRSLSPMLQGLSSISCAAAMTCLAVGDAGAGLVGPDGDESNVPGAYYLGGYTAAVAVRTADGGAKWSSLVPELGLSDLPSVSCSSALRCIAVGDDTERGTAALLRTIDGGSRWTATLAPKPVRYLEEISCASATVCVAAGYSWINGVSVTRILRTTDFGVHWRVVASLPAVTEVHQLVCTTILRCMGFEAANNGAWVVFMSTNGGRTWQQSAVPIGSSDNVEGIACSSALDCIIYGTGFSLTVMAVTDSWGEAWRSVAAPPAFGFITSVACPSATVCIAVGGGNSGQGQLMESNDAGVSWSFIGAGPSGISALSCLGPTTCVAIAATSSADESYQALSTRDLFRTWRAFDLPPKFQIFSAFQTSLACSLSGSCFTVSGTSGAGGPGIVKTRNVFDWKEDGTTR